MPTFSAICTCGYSNIRINLSSEVFDLKVYCMKCNEILISGSHKEQNAENDQRVDKKSSFAKTTNDKENTKNQFGKYSILKKLGEGGMAVVYLGIDNETKEQVALKIFKKIENKNFVKYIIREGEILLKLEHPNIVSLKNWGNYQGYPYLAMEYISGHNLAQIISKSHLRPIDAIQIMIYIIDALIHASQYQIIHRDIKPDNIIIAEDGLVKLIDMGVGKMLEDSGVLTETGEIIGTCFYMPPEQLKNSKYVDFRADMYGIGATLYHALCGIPPYWEYEKHINKLVFAKINENFIPLSSHNEKIPRMVVEIVEKAMAHRPEQRYETFFQMKEEWLKVYNYLNSQ